jgi:hypothetical protein
MQSPNWAALAQFNQQGKPWIQFFWICRFIELGLEKVFNHIFIQDTWIFNLFTKMSRTPAGSQPPKHTYFNKILNWIFSKIIFAQSLCILHSDCAFTIF